MIDGSAYRFLGRFLLVGGSGALLNLLLLWLFASVFGLWYLASSVAGYCIAMGYNFLLQRLWAFRAIAGSVVSQLPYFVLINLLGLLLNTAILYLLVEELGIWYLAGQAAASLVVAGQSFFAYRWIFRPRIVP